MAISAQTIQSWLAANPGATDRDMAAAMNQYGVSAQDLSGATGWDQGAVADRFSTANAQNYIDQQYGQQLQPDGTFAPHSLFTNGVYDYSNPLTNYGVLGAGQSMGYDADKMSKILGLSADQISGYTQANQPQVNSYAQEFQHDQSNPAPYMLQFDGANPFPASTGLPGGSSGAITGQGGTPAAGSPGVVTTQDFGLQHDQAPIGQYGSTGPAMGGGQPLPGQPGSPYYGMGGMAGGSGSGGYQGSNPYLSGMADEIGRRTQQGLGQAFNGIRSNAIGVGGLGGSRQGVAEGIATRGAMDSLQGNLAGLYGGQYNADANRDLSRYGMDQNFYTQQRGQDQTGLALGANLWNQGNQAEWNPLLQAGNVLGPFTGFGTTSTGGQSGGGWQGGVGGLLAGGSFGKSMGWW